MAVSYLLQDRQYVCYMARIIRTWDLDAHVYAPLLISSRQRVGDILDHFDPGLLGLGQVARHLDGAAVLDIPTHHCAGQPARIRRSRRLAAPGSRLGPAPEHGLGLECCPAYRSIHR